MLWPAISITLSLFLTLSVVGLVYFWLDRTRWKREASTSAEELLQAEQQLESLRQANHEFEKEIAVARQTQVGLEKQYTELEKRQREVFQALAGDVLKQSSEQFLQLAKKSLESEKKDATFELEKRKQAIQELVKPVREQLDKYQTQVNELEKARKEAYGSLKEQVTALTEGNQALRDQTQNLVSALRRPEVRGRWGEVQLRRVAELAGMIEYCDFDLQFTMQSGENRQRPDMIVRLPTERSIIVDAKTPIDAYLSAMEAEDASQREIHLDRHVRQIRDQVKSLSAKDYVSQFDATPDFVVLFIPGESFLQAAVQREPTLIEKAMTQGVVIATPSTLVALLKAVALGWREEKLAENARKISDLGRELHSRLSVALKHLSNLGKAVDKTVEHYNKLVGSMESQVYTQAKRFEELGANSSKSLEEPKTSQVELRRVTKAESENL